MGLILGVGWFTIYFLAHLAVIRVAPAKTKPRLTQRVFIAGVAGIAMSLWLGLGRVSDPLLAHGAWPLAVLCGELVYVGLFIIYMPFYYTVVASLSVQTLIMLERTSDGRLSVALLRERFASRELVGERLATLVVNGFLIEQRHGYTLSPKGRLVARVFAFVKRFWKLGAGG